MFDGTVNEDVLHQAVKVYLNNQRQGTAKTKGRSEVSGGNQKPWKQKGTGRARQGSIRAPQFAGGGVVHGPAPRDYSQRTPKKMKAAALRGVEVRILSDCQCLCTTMYRIDQPHLLWVLDNLCGIGTPDEKPRVVNSIRVHPVAREKALKSLERMLSLTGKKFETCKLVAVD